MMALRTRQYLTFMLVMLVSSIGITFFHSTQQTNKYLHDVLVLEDAQHPHELNSRALTDDSAITRAASMTTLVTARNLTDPKIYKRIWNLWEPLEEMSYALLPNVFTRKEALDSNDIVMAIHLGMTRLPRLLFSLRQWAGPASVSVVLFSHDDILTFCTFLETIIDVDETLRLKTSFHVMLEKSNTTGSSNYPHNILREMALQHVESMYFVALDLDMVVSSIDSYSRLRSLVASDQRIQTALANKTFFVLPTLDLRYNVENSELPLLPHNLTKHMALKFLESGLLAEFHVDFFPAGHGPTNYTEWRRVPQPPNGTEVVAPLEPFYSINYGYKFEPYVLGMRSLVPHYWPHFRGFGINKFSWFVEADCMKFKFAVLRDFFVVHLGHSYDTKPNTKRAIEPKTHREFRNFRHYLEGEYGDCVVEKDPAHTVQWELLSPKEKEAAERAGFNQTMWDSGDWPENLMYAWDSLDGPDRESMLLLGYNNLTWT